VSHDEIIQRAMALPLPARADLAARLLGSIPVILTDPDEGVEEAKRRSRELDEHPDGGMTWEEVRSGLGR